MTTSSADYITKLEQQVAAMQRANDHQHSLIETAQDQLAASQAREQKLRGAFSAIAEDTVPCDHNGWPRQTRREYARAQLALPQDDTILQERLKEEREKVAQFVTDYSDEHGLITMRLAAAIRSMK